MQRSCALRQQIAYCLIIQKISIVSMTRHNFSQVAFKRVLCVMNAFVVLFIANFARIICPGKSAARINLIARTVFRSFGITRLSFSIVKLKQNNNHTLICPNFHYFPMILTSLERKNSSGLNPFVHCLKHFKILSFRGNTDKHRVQFRCILLFVYSKHRAVQRMCICPM